MKAMVAAALVLFSSAWAAAEKSPVAKVGVLDLKASGLDESVANNLSELLISEVGKIPGTKVMSRREAEDVVGFAIDQQSMGCDDPKCLAEVGNALGADLLVSGSVGVVGETYVVSLKLIDLEKLETKNRVADTIAGRVELLTYFIRVAAWTLFEQPVPETLASAYASEKQRLEHSNTQPAKGRRDAAKLGQAPDAQAAEPMLLIEPEPPPPGPTPLQQWARPMRKMSTGLALLGLVGGAGMHGFSFYRAQQVGSESTAADGGGIYTKGTQRAAAQARSFQRGAYIAYGVGGAFVVAAVVFAMLEPAAPKPSAWRFVPQADGFAVHF